jgi:hypothetical protein
MNINKIINLYKKGLSINKISKLLSINRDRVRAILTYRGLTRLAPGRAMEKKVATFLEDRGHKVERQKGDRPFDLLVDGKRIDVKSAHLSGKFLDGWRFEMQHDFSREKIHANFIDEFYLVFMENENNRIFCLDSNEVHVKKMLRIPRSFNTKYNLKYIGILREGVSI